MHPGFYHLDCYIPWYVKLYLINFWPTSFSFSSIFPICLLFNLISLLSTHQLFYDPFSPYLLSLLMASLPSSSKLDIKHITSTIVFLLYLTLQSLNLDQPNYLLYPIFICHLAAHCYPYTFRIPKLTWSFGSSVSFKKIYLIPFSYSTGPRFSLVFSSYPSYLFCLPLLTGKIKTIVYDNCKTPGFLFMKYLPPHHPTSLCSTAEEVTLPEQSLSFCVAVRGSLGF